MGLYDREYYREEHARRQSWQIGPVTLSFIAITTIAFMGQLLTLDLRQYGKWCDPLLYWGGFSVDKILNGQFWRLITSIVLHHPSDTIWLIVASLIILAYTGRGVEGTYGPKEMFWYYVLSGIVTQLVLLAVSIARPLQFIPPEPGYGCGGSVAAIMVLFARLAPEERISLLLGSVKASTLAAIIVLVNVALFASTNGRYFSAITVCSGAVFAVAYHHYGWRISNWIPDFPRTRSRGNLRRTVPSPAYQGAYIETPQPNPVSPPPIRKPDSTVEAPITGDDDQLEVELDRVLAKVAKTGRASLTPEENALLLRASEIYKMKRKC